LILVTAIITSLYSIRLFIFTFYTKPNFSYNIYLDTNIPFFFLFPISILALGAVIFGYFTQNLPYSTVVHLFTHPTHNHLLDNLTFHNILSLLPLIAFFIFIIPFFNIEWKGNINILHNFNVYYHYVLLHYLTFSNIILRYWDRGFIEIFTPYGLLNLLNYLSYL
jgi:NADH:ubiquinone oxidoreductase subunit 5 (subunit L)/multisubunit Na+/H+ antiporter MnhA subunit